MTAGLSAAMSSGKWPGRTALSFTTLIAASTAPHEEWPSTTMSGAPRNCKPYSMDARQVRGHDVARDAHDEEIARRLVERELRRARANRRSSRSRRSDTALRARARPDEKSRSFGVLAA